MTGAGIATVVLSGLLLVASANSSEPDPANGKGVALSGMVIGSVALLTGVVIMARSASAVAVTTE